MSLIENVSKEAKDYADRMVKQAQLVWDAQWEDQVADMRGNAFDSIVRTAIIAVLLGFFIGYLVGVNVK